MDPPFKLDSSTLQPFKDAAAGHDGTLSDPTGTLFIKPCTQAEVDFYTSVTSDHPHLAHFTPTYMGTLTKSDPEESPGVPTEALAPPPADSLAQAGALALKMANIPTPSNTIPSTTNNTPAPVNNSIEPDTTHLHGRPLSTTLHIVLGSVTTGFTRANVLDLKLGSRLWADDAPPAKRARLDAVSNVTTSRSLGFRVAGMRVWQGPRHSVVGKGAENTETDSEGMKVYNKLFGRGLKDAEVESAVRSFVCVPGAGIDIYTAIKLLKAFNQEIKEVRELLEKTEVRLVGSSILFAYEGDGEAFRRKEGELVRRAAEGGDGESESDEDETEGPVLYRIKLIDFAHSRVVPGEGPDENILPGVRNIERIFNDLYDKLVAEVEQ